MKMIKLEKILAENMRRFNTKNLSEQTATDIVSIIKNLDPELPALLDTIDKERKYGILVKTTKNSIIEFTPNNDGGSTYSLQIYKINERLPIPVPYTIASFIKRQDNWRKGTENDVTIAPRRGADSLEKYKNAGTTIADKLNTLWNDMSWAINKTSELLEAATNYVITNAERFKPSFHQVTRSANGIKQFWNDNPQNYNRSQYYLAVGQKVSGNAKKILDAIQDTELIAAIQYKAKNWNNGGEYPALKIPTPLS